MTKKTTSRRPTSRSTQVTLGGILGAILLGLAIIAQLTGYDPLGLFAPPPATAPAPAETGDNLAAPLSVFFTAPTGSSDRSTYVGGLEDTLAAAIRGARQTVDVAAFELNSRPIADALLDRHRQGVRVRLVTDNEHGLNVALYQRYRTATGSAKEDIRLQFITDPDDTLLDELYEAGIPIVDDGRNGLMHNKFVIIDGSEVWTGSYNLTVNDTYRNNNNLVHVRSARVAENYQVEFNEMFQDRRFGPTSPANTPNPRVVVNNVPLEVYFAPEDRVIDRIIEKINAAQTSMKFMAFSFTENALGEAVLRRVANGLHVEGVVETTGSITQWSELPKFFCAGLDVRQDGNPYMLHHKVIILDDRITIIGSFNFSGSATDTNDENLMIIEDPAIAASYLAEYQRRFAEGRVPQGINCTTVTPVAP